jgi:hypothetical protein
MSLIPGRFAEWEEIYSFELMQVNTISWSCPVCDGNEVFPHKDLVFLTALHLFGVSAEGDSQLAHTMP